MRFFDDLIAKFEDLLRLPEVVWNRQPHLIDHIKHALSVHHKVAAHRQPSCLDHQFLECIDEIEDLHMCPTRAHVLVLSVLLAQCGANVRWDEIGYVIAQP